MQDSSFHVSTAVTLASLRLHIYAIGVCHAPFSSPLLECFFSYHMCSSCLHGGYLSGPTNCLSASAFLHGCLAFLRFSYSQNHSYSSHKVFARACHSTAIGEVSRGCFLFRMQRPLPRDVPELAAGRLERLRIRRISSW